MAKKVRHKKKKKIKRRSKHRAPKKRRTLKKKKQKLQTKKPRFGKKLRPAKKSRAAKKGAFFIFKQKGSALPRVKKVSFKGLSVRQIAARISKHLTNLGYEPALTGKACAAFYAGPSIKPKAIDFVTRSYELEKLAHAMREIGFHNTEMNIFENDRCPVTVSISPPPLAVGDDIIENVETKKTRDGNISMLNPTDCVRQRLSMFYRWGDHDALNDAIIVTKRNRVDLDLVGKWSQWEWCGDKFDDFLHALKKKHY